MKALTKAQTVRRITSETLEHLAGLREQFAVLTGGGDPDGYDDETKQLVYENNDEWYNGKYYNL